eukprot:12213036-Alexandrium_andersonii.AAC.1
MSASLVGSEMCIRDRARAQRVARRTGHAARAPQPDQRARRLVFRPLGRRGSARIARLLRRSPLLLALRG